MSIYVLDGKGRWFPEIAKAAERAGMKAHIFGGNREEAYGFIRPSPIPALLVKHRNDYREMVRCGLKMIQDADQVDFYEDKSAQFAVYADWMPDTWRFTSQDEAMVFLGNAAFPLVSKANEGSSSRNVRILQDRQQAEEHVRSVFQGGVPVDLGQHSTIQRDYVLLQRFIPHTTTYRVNAIGNARAIFFRYCYPDKNVAQTGNVEPCEQMSEEIESLMEWSDSFFHAAKTKWCAIDVLKDGGKWMLLETGLAWPWPSPGRCNQAPIFRSTRPWIQMFDVMFDQIKAGAF